MARRTTVIDTTSALKVSRAAKGPAKAVTTVPVKQAKVTKAAGKVSNKTNKLVLQLDDRTAKLSQPALFCRTYGHKWGVLPIGAQRHAELLRRGLTETFRECEHGCGSTWWEVWELSSGRVLDFARRYSAAGDETGQYLLPKGTGRLPRAEARKANFARQFPEFVTVGT
jgi:hypothetical protein